MQIRHMAATNKGLMEYVQTQSGALVDVQRLENFEHCALSAILNGLVFS
jgi:hypothetical protein